MQQFTDRDMIRVLKDVGLWEILCGISLSNAKDEESPRGASSSNAIFAEPGDLPSYLLMDLSKDFSDKLHQWCCVPDLFLTISLEILGIIQIGASGREAA